MQKRKALENTLKQLKRSNVIYKRRCPKSLKNCHPERSEEFKILTMRLTSLNSHCVARFFALLRMAEKCKYSTFGTPSFSIYMTYN